MTVEPLKSVSEYILELEDGDQLLPSDVQARANEGVARLLKLKEYHRKLCLATESLREATGDAKAQLNQSSLQLQNLIYEQQHYENEIRLCKAFKSRFTDEELELVHEEEFRGIAQLEDSTPHQFMLARLGHELAFRKDTLADLEDLKSKRDILASEVAQKRNDLSLIESEIKRLNAAVHKALEHIFSDVEPMQP